MRAGIPASDKALTARVVGAKPYTEYPRDPVMARARLPFGAKLAFAAAIFREPALVSDILHRGGAVYASVFHLLLDILAATGERHHLLARVAGQLPSSVPSGDLDWVSELLNFAGQLRAVNCGREAPRAIDFNRIEAAPLSVRAAGHVGDHDVGVKVRIGTIAVIGAFGRPRGDMVEPGRHNVFGDDPFAAASPARERVALKLGTRVNAFAGRRGSGRDYADRQNAPR